MTKRKDLERRLRAEWESLVEPASSEPTTFRPATLPPLERMPLSRPALFAELENVRRTWQELTPGVLLYSDRFVNAAWTMRELVAHLASWAREFRHEVETVARHEAFDYAIPFALSVVGPNQWNAEQVHARRERSTEELLQDIDDETRSLQELVLELDDAALYEPALFPHAPSGNTDERWRGTNAVVILGRCEHDRHHLRQIRDRIRTFASNP